MHQIRKPHPEEINCAYEEGRAGYYICVNNPYNLTDNPELHGAWEDGRRDEHEEQEREE